MSNPNAKFWSRPHHPHNPGEPELLVDHLVAVEAHTLCNTPATTTLSDGTPTRPILQVMAWMHDLGKLTTWWQRDHDNTAQPTISRPAGRVSDHSFLGGVATWWVLEQLGYDPYIRLLAGVSVARHHNTLPNLSEYFMTRFTDVSSWQTARKQVDNIDTHADEVATQIFQTAVDRFHSVSGGEVDISWSDFCQTLCADYRADVKQSVTMLTGQKLKREYQSQAVYTDLLELWGGLKAADTPASAGVQPAPDRTLPEAEHVTEYVSNVLSPPDNPNTQSERLNQKRERIRRQTLDALADRLTDSENGSKEGHTPSGQVYTLTLPTGAGKTLTGTQAALRLHHATNQSGKLLYILPYTSIIDQTESVYTDLFGYDSGEATPTVGVDHYLANSAESDDGSDASGDTGGDGDGLVEKNTDGNMAATTLWYNDITLSTTVQLWETLCGPSKSQVTKLPQLYDSTIIIDEPQSLPTEWFGRVEELLATLRDTFHANVILMSATQPPISYPPEAVDSETQELSPDVEMPDNTTVNIDTSVTSETLRSDAEVARTLVDDLDTGTHSVLSIHNTISNTNRSATALKVELDDRGRDFTSIHTIYSDLLDETPLAADTTPTESDVYDTLPSVNEIVSEVKELDSGVLTTTLTTRHRPCDRSRILDALIALLGEQTSGSSDNNDIPQIVAITTQLVEAGVDISFESLYRDLAPYDSLIQAAGRCNREYEYGVGGGDLTVWHLDDNGDGGATPADYIYQTGGANRLYHTIETLAPLDSTENPTTESTLIDAYTTYKDALQSKLSLSTDALDSVAGDTLTRASLIPDNGKSVSVCIARTPIETKLIDAYRDVEAHNPNQLREIRDILSHIECNIRVDENTNITEMAHQIDDTLYVVDDAQVDAAYSELGVSPMISDTVSHRIF